MDSLFNTPLKTIADAEGFIFQLVQLGMAFHPEDNAFDIIKSKDGGRLFTDEQAELINERRFELFELLDDPSETMLETLRKWG